MCGGCGWWGRTRVQKLKNQESVHTKRASHLPGTADSAKNDAPEWPPLLPASTSLPAPHTHKRVTLRQLPVTVA